MDDFIKRVNNVSNINKDETDGTIWMTSYRRVNNVSNINKDETDGTIWMTSLSV